MKTWDDWSDLEINAHMTLIICNLNGWEYSENTETFYNCGSLGNEMHTQQVISFCDSWAVMGPLIFDNDINYLKDHGGYLAFVKATWIGMRIKKWIVDGFCSEGHCCHRDKDSPLRASAIVFLMMNGVNPE